MWQRVKRSVLWLGALSLVIWTLGTIATAATLTLKPNGPGAYEEIPWEIPPYSVHWQCVSDGDTDTYLASYTSSEAKDFYSLEDPPPGISGTITEVKVYFTVNTNYSATGDNYRRARPWLRLGDDETGGTEVDCYHLDWRTYSESLDRPGGGDWSWDDIANLQVGIGLWRKNWHWACCAELWVEVTYTPPCTPPTITCPGDITVENDSGECSAVVTWADPIVTGDPTPTVSCTPASGSTFPVGTTSVTCTATNSCGTATCTFTVTVVDAEDPVISGCPSDITVNNDPGECGAGELGGAHRQRQLWD